MKTIKELEAELMIVRNDEKMSGKDFSQTKENLILIRKALKDVLKLIDEMRTGGYEKGWSVDGEELKQKIQGK